MKRIYEVTYEERWAGCKPIEASVKVFANGSLFAAIAKAKKHVLAQNFADDDGKTRRCVSFKPLGVEVIAEADI